MTTSYFRQKSEEAAIRYTKRHFIFKRIAASSLFDKIWTVIPNEVRNLLLMTSNSNQGDHRL